MIDNAKSKCPRRTHGRNRQILVTGSARLDMYRFGGDSLQGRYFYLRLHPFSVAELGGHADALPALLALGGFPEPFTDGTETFARRWVQSYRERLIRGEVTNLENIADLGKLELLALTLPTRVGSPLSLNALRENLVACHLLKWVEFRVDTRGRTLELRNFRDIDGREVDFVIVEGACNPIAMVECK